MPEAVRTEVLAPDPRYPHPVYGYQELFRLQHWPSVVEKGEQSCQEKRVRPSPQNGSPNLFTSPLRKQMTWRNWSPGRLTRKLHSCDEALRGAFGVEPEEEQRETAVVSRP